MATTAPRYPGIPAVTSDAELAAAVRALVEVVQILVGAVGTGEARAATAAELTALAKRVTVLEDA